MKIGLALSGGGVLGIAHLGVLEELERNKIDVNIISGTSAGAIIGALFASGGSNKVKDFIAELEKAGLFDTKRVFLNLNPDGIFNTVRQSLEKCLKGVQFYDLDKKFICTATDLQDGKMAAFDKGNLIDCIMASSAYPGVFPPQQIDGRYYIDGGITRNLPAEILRKKGADFIIGSSLYNISGYEKISEEGGLKANRIDIVLRSLDIMQKEMASLEKKNCDFCFVPPVYSYNWYSFSKMEEIEEIGRNHAKSRLEDLAKKIKQKEKPAFWQRIIKNF